MNIPYKWLIGSFFLILIIGFIGTIMYARHLNNNEVIRLKNILMEFPIPQGVQIISTHHKMGLQTCCSNHCDYFTGIALASSLDTTELKNTLLKDSTATRPIFPVLHKNQEVLFILDLQKYRRIMSEIPSGLDELMKQNIKIPENTSLHYAYILTRKDEGFSFHWDMRCH